MQLWILSFYYFGKHDLISQVSFVCVLFSHGPLCLWTCYTSEVCAYFINNELRFLTYRTFTLFFALNRKISLFSHWFTRTVIVFDYLRCTSIRILLEKSSCSLSLFLRTVLRIKNRLQNFADFELAFSWRLEIPCWSGRVVRLSLAQRGNFTRC